MGPLKFLACSTWDYIKFFAIVEVFGWYLFFVMINSAR